MENMDRVWDYAAGGNLKPADKAEWLWYLERKINYDNWRGLDVKMVRRYFKDLKIDPAKRMLLRAFFKYEGNV